MDENYMSDLEDLVYALIAVQNEVKRIRVLAGRMTIHEYSILDLNRSYVCLLQTIKKVNTIINRINTRYNEYNEPISFQTTSFE